MAVQPLPDDLGHPRKAGDSIELLRRRYGLAAPGAIADLRARWTSLVGEVVARRSEVIDLRDGTLRVRVEDPAVAQRLRWDEARILVEASRSEEVRTLVIKVAPPRDRS